MSASSLITFTEREVYVRYERQRRLQMLRSVTPAFIVICLLVFLVIAAFLLFFPAPADGKKSMVITDGLLLVVMTVLGLGILAVRAERLTLATALVAGASALGTSASVAVWSSFLGLDPFALLEFTPFSVVVVLAGVFGSLWTIVITTAVMNTLTVALLLFMPRAPGMESLFTQELPLVLPVALAYQWLFASLMIAIWLIFQRTLNEVGVAYERAKQLDTLKDEFISSVNHELRTPLMAMQTYLETLRLSPGSLTTDQLQSALNEACEVGDSLVDLVKSILSARRIDQEAVAFMPGALPLREAVEAASRLIDPREAQLIQRDLHVHIADNLLVWGDRVRLQQVLTNLLSNAIKYSAAGTPIEVQARRVEHPVEPPSRWTWTRGETQSVIELTVRDYGHGIPADQIPLLFNRFMRLPRDLASKVTGTGLGLYLCRVMTEAMGGRIWVESTGVEGEGCTFFLHLPIPPADVAGAPTAAPATTSA